MTTLVFDGQVSASGEQLLGSLLAVGADTDRLTQVERALGVRYDVETHVTAGLTATRVTVTSSTGPASKKRSSRAAVPSQAGLIDTHAQSHTHGQNQSANYNEPIATLWRGIDSIPLGPRVEATTRRIVERLADERPAATDADAIVRPYDGVDEAMAVVVGVSQLLVDLGVDAVYTISHGVDDGPESVDAAIRQAVATGVETLPKVGVERVGYGTGPAGQEASRNVLRAIIGRT